MKAQQKKSEALHKELQLAYVGAAHPENGTNVVTTKILSAGIIFYFLDSQPEHRKTRDLWIINGLQFGAVINNFEVGIRFKYIF